MKSKAKPIESEAEARSYLMDLLARRDYPRSQLQQKLQQRECPAEIAESLLNQFAAAGYQSDQRFVDAQVRQRLEQGQGRRKIEYDLRQKGVSAEMINTTLNNLDCKENQRALEYYKRRYGDRPATDQKERAKRFRHMAGRGFGFDEINYAIRHQLSEEAQ
ncbi:MAG TPA: regulatory protein RecX [Marinobacterium sp.]|nr:regulatory protein RecX [Marinobacterium sp.]